MSFPFDAVIFDLDGTLIDSMGVWADVDIEFLRKRGLTPPPDLFSDLEEGNSFEEVASYFKAKFGLPESIHEIMAEWTDMVAHHYRTSIPLKPGVADLLEQLRVRGVKLGVGTSNSEPLARAALVANGVEHYFGCLIVGGGELRGKPCPDIFLAAARCLGVPPERCLVFEDVLAGVQAARAAGMAVTGIRDLHARADWPEMEKLTDAMLDNFTGVEAWIIRHYATSKP